MEKKDLEDLIKKYNDQTATSQEKAVVEEWFRQVAMSTAQQEELPDLEEVKADIWERLYPHQKPRSRPLSHYLMAAASLAIVLISAIYMISNSGSADPAGNYATLKMSSGEIISLSPDQSGRIYQKAGITVVKDSSQITIKIDSTYSLSGNGTNTLTTPAGKQFKVQLADGSLVYLNAESSLTFPQRFGSERKVQLTGEGYFEINKDAHRPFKVLSLNQMLRVLGTHFNVTSYFSNSTTVTLVEGSVMIEPKTGKPVQLRPGQQSINTGQGIQVQKVNAEDYIAWKDGMFVWVGCPLNEVLQQLSRWYNVDLESVSSHSEPVYGRFPKNRTLSEVLKYIEYSGEIKIHVKGRRQMTP